MPGRAIEPRIEVLTSCKEEENYYEIDSREIITRDAVGTGRVFRPYTYYAS
jgi:hypothetical protein